ncbi:putative 2-dehydropantoate 2-reductase [Talaromyces proteolyticus]|uniref:2-dehydropantoate 2-reductase n=1 Tax=Talaromyces proteolyticus TaxID=1131652 RepID=A0AAD4KXR4_9EURO|nr:putative 2-dehydropantoate 2-reductase [Talaromyces proteolyticus]KAH8698421.1 putative 2-dehydropantoate 2-reductase [Talaromyces proteolyticus]
MSSAKAKVLILGTGGVGTMAAYALEIGGKAEVTAIMRSNYEAVERNGININSIDHGHDIKGWRPTTIRKEVPNVVEEGLPSFDYILITTKNVADIPPSVAAIIEPAVTPGKTSIVLSQNGLNIEKPLIAKFPTNPLISSVSMISVTETGHGNVLHDFPDAQTIGPFNSPGVSAEISEAAARQYINIYNACDKLSLTYEANILETRWRKLLYNASFNSVAAILRMDTLRMRMSEHIIDDLIRPIMLEIKAGAHAYGIHLADETLEYLIRVDPIGAPFKPSMCQDIEKGNYIELETIIGEPLRAGEAKGVSMPMLRTVYGLLKGLQLKTKESKGLWTSEFTESNPYQ